MWQITLQHPEFSDFTSLGPLPQRHGVPDCLYYMRTGMCGYGNSCKFNHPPNRRMGVIADKDKEEYPVREDQPECQYYMKTGTCKFGSNCRFHHPKGKAGISGRVSLNSEGLPLREGEKDCAYYVRTGACKFGSACKFNHPSPSASNNNNNKGNLQQVFPSWSVARVPSIPALQFTSSSSYPQVIVPHQGLVSLPGWSNYQVRMLQNDSRTGITASQKGIGAASILYATPSPVDGISNSVYAAYSPYIAGTNTMSTSKKELSFPERPGEPECQYYIKTGDCKFGSTCRFHHPKERATTVPSDCALSPLGLPLRPGALQCAYYMRYGSCKFGASCRFDHPVVAFAYSPSVNSLLDMPIAQMSAPNSTLSSLETTPLKRNNKVVLGKAASVEVIQDTCSENGDSKTLIIG